MGLRVRKTSGLQGVWPANRPIPEPCGFGAAWGQRTEDQRAEGAWPGTCAGDSHGGGGARGPQGPRWLRRETVDQGPARRASGSLGAKEAHVLGRGQQR